jgi:hypothetical protein
LAAKKTPMKVRFNKAVAAIEKARAAGLEVTCLSKLSDEQGELRVMYYAWGGPAWAAASELYHALVRYSDDRSATQSPFQTFWFKGGQ